KEHTSAMMWMCVAVFLLWMRSGRCTDKANTSDLIEYTAVDFYEKLHSGKMMFIYFEHQGRQLTAHAISAVLLYICHRSHTPHYQACDVKHASVLNKRLFSSSAILRDEIKYVHTDADLLAMEKAARGKKDIVLGYVCSLGTQGMGRRTGRIVITVRLGRSCLCVSFSVNESSPSSRVWFLHCRVHSGFMTPMTSERCPLTRMRKPLSTLSLHSFLQLMEAPLTEVYDDPSSVQPPQFPYQQTPQVFLFSHPATEHLDLDTATTLAWRLRGLALLLLVHRCSPAVKTPDEYNAAYRLPEKVLEVKYLTLNSLDEVLVLFADQEKDEEEEEVDDEEDNEGKLDDEIAAAVFENRGTLSDMDSVTQLTSDNFHTAVAQSGLTVVLFYLKFQMSVVDCSEWTDLCAAQPGSAVPFQPITAFPSVLFLHPQHPAHHFRGMLGSESLHHGVFPVSHITYSFFPNFSLLPCLAAFTEAAKSLRGEALTGLLTDELAEKWYELYHFKVESREGKRWSDIWPAGSICTFLFLLICCSIFPSCKQSRIPTFFVNAVHVILTIIIYFCFSGRTPAGMSVLGSYVGSMPPLPALVLTHLPSGDQIYQYPPNTPIVASSVLHWLQRVEDGTESPTGKEERTESLKLSLQSHKFQDSYAIQL
uniref:Thioredoxin domain containing 16 n=1 Tax=Neolamprologus brichardi TaxID=32507 RepID=A0A3Q4IB36_NEOBR